MPIGRGLVYGVGLWVFLGATAMTLAAIIIPEWITWDTQTELAKKIHYTYGLHQRCSSIDQTCTPFPRWEDCQGLDRAFCSKWRTTGFLLSLSTILEFATAVAFAVVLFGGKQRREQGWKVLAGCMGVCVACQVAGMAIIAHLFEVDERFFEGWKLDRSFWLCVGSWGVQVLVAVGVSVAAVWLPEEGGYELIPEPGARRNR